jgi:hypothetical protein
MLVNQIFTINIYSHCFVNKIGYPQFHQYIYRFYPYGNSNNFAT